MDNKAIISFIRDKYCDKKTSAEYQLQVNSIVKLETSFPDGLSQCKKTISPVKQCL